MVGLMPEIEHALAKLTALDVISSEAQLFLEALRHAVVAAEPWHSVEKVFEKADAGRARARSDYDSAVQVYGMVEGGDPFKYDKLFDSGYEMSISDLDLPRSDAADHVLEAPSALTEAWHGKTVQRANHVLLDSMAFIRTICTGELGRARESGLVLCTSRADSSQARAKRARVLRVHWRAGSILLASGSNRGQRADSIPLAARVGSSRGPRADPSPLALMSLIDQTIVTSDCHSSILLAAPRPTFYHYVLVSCHAID